MWLEPVVSIQKHDRFMPIRYGEQGTEPARRITEVAMGMVEPEVLDMSDVVDPLPRMSVGDQQVRCRSVLLTDAADVALQDAVGLVEIGRDDYGAPGHWAIPPLAIKFRV
jgi:hypothetical protein